MHSLWQDMMIFLDLLFEYYNNVMKVEIYCESSILE